MDVTVLLMALAGALCVAAIVFGVVQIATNASLSPLEKWVWMIAVVCFPLVGAIVWYLLGPHPLGLRIGHTEHRGR
jgi:hypothetical protein